MADAIFLTVQASPLRFGENFCAHGLEKKFLYTGQLTLLANFCIVPEGTLIGTQPREPTSPPPPAVWQSIPQRIRALVSQPIPWIRVSTQQPKSDHARDDLLIGTDAGVERIVSESGNHTGELDPHLDRYR